MGNSLVALELVPTSKRLLGSNILQGITELARSRATHCKDIYQPCHIWAALACQACIWWTGHGIGPEFGNIYGSIRAEAQNQMGLWMYVIQLIFDFLYYIKFLLILNIHLLYNPV